MWSSCSDGSILSDRQQVDSLITRYKLQALQGTSMMGVRGCGEDGHGRHLLLKRPRAAVAIGKICEKQAHN